MAQLSEIHAQSEGSGDNYTENAALLATMAATSRAAGRTLRLATPETRTNAILSIAQHIRDDASNIPAANQTDLLAFDGPPPMRDRLMLSPERIVAMASGLEDVARQPDPVGQIMESRTRPNGLRIARIGAPIGVIGLIYESRPGVGVDAAALCIRSGNSAILRGGSESRLTSAVLNASVRAGLLAAGLPEGCTQIVPTTSRSMVAAMLAGAGQLDLLIPRGGKSLIERVQREAKVPILQHYRT